MSHGHPLEVGGHNRRGGGSDGGWIGREGHLTLCNNCGGGGYLGGPTIVNEIKNIYETINTL